MTPARLDHAAALATLQQLDLVQLRADIAEKRAELERLEEFCRAVDVLQNGKKPRKTRNTRNGNETEPVGTLDPPITHRKPGRKPKAQRIADVVRTHRQISAKRIAELTQLSESDVLYVLNNGFEGMQFDMEADGKWFILT